MNKTLFLIPVVFAALVVGSLTLAKPAEAMGWGMRDDSLATDLAKRFNLNESDVKSFFNDRRNAIHTDHRKKLEERLSQLVKDGKITEDQKLKVLAKMDELSTAEKSWQSLSLEERKAKIKSAQQDLKKWMTDNSIPTNLGFLRMRHHGWWK